MNIYELSPAALPAVCTRKNLRLPWLNTSYSVPATCMCACHCILNCVYVLKHRNTINVARRYNMYMTSQVVWYKSNWGRIRKRKMDAQSVCVCVFVPEWNCVLYLLYGHTLLHWSSLFLCRNLRLKSDSSSGWGGSPTCFLSKNTCSVYLSHFAVLIKITGTIRSNGRFSRHHRSFICVLRTLHLNYYHMLLHYKSAIHFAQES